MKRKLVLTLICSMIFIFASCSKEEENNKYTITYNGSRSSITIDIFEYDKNGEPVFHTKDKFSIGSSREYSAQSGSAKVKLCSLSGYSGYYYGWVQTIYSIPATIVINDNTKFGFSEP